VGFPAKRMIEIFTTDSGSPGVVDFESFAFIVG
jgi:hypothetical protein